MGSAAAQLCRPTNPHRVRIAAPPGTRQAPRPAPIAATRCRRLRQATPRRATRPRGRSSSLRRRTARPTILPRDTRRCPSTRERRMAIRDSRVSQVRRIRRTPRRGTLRGRDIPSSQGPTGRLQAIRPTPPTRRPLGRQRCGSSARPSPSPWRCRLSWCVTSKSLPTRSWAWWG